MQAASIVLKQACSNLSVVESFLLGLDTPALTVIETLERHLKIETFTSDALTILAGNLFSVLTHLSAYSNQDSLAVAKVKEDVIK